jgi:crossover junction endodeoxyribonuclease RuvC
MMKFRTSTQMQNNICLAVDPGFGRLGISVMSKVNGKEKIIYSACLETDKRAEQAERLFAISCELRRIIKKYKPTSLAIEKLFFNQNITTALKVAEARGVVLAESASAGLSIYEYGPQAIKLAVTGYGKASKPDVQRMTMRLIGLKTKPKYDDETDAIALGITHLASQRHI